MDKCNHKDGGNVHFCILSSRHTKVSVHLFTKQKAMVNSPIKRGIICGPFSELGVMVGFFV